MAAARIHRGINNFSGEIKPAVLEGGVAGRQTGRVYRNIAREIRSRRWLPLVRSFAADVNYQIGVLSHAGWTLISGAFGMTSAGNYMKGLYVQGGPIYTLGGFFTLPEQMEKSSYLGLVLPEKFNGEINLFFARRRMFFIFCRFLRHLITFCLWKFKITRICRNR